MKFLMHCLLCLSLPVFAQEPKGATPRPTHHSSLITHHSTRAVVVGISDYQDPAIPDLRFADRDAEAFAAWLRSPAGLALPDSNIRLATNQKATNAQMIVALDWLIERSQPGDRAFIYFSGHGDVERVTKFQRGFLLGYDSPPTVYGAGAFSLGYLQDILSTLSQNEVQVFIITDACHAGKLAGSIVNGTQATATQLSQQFSNEIKIMSCQPDEFSLEGEQWGGGRGCFSYHLEDALYGFADDNHDLSVDLRELRRYLEDHVSAEAEPQSQVPMVSGPMKMQVASVRAGEVAARRATRGQARTPFRAIENRGMETQLLARVDSSIRRLYAQFLAAIDSGHLLQPAGYSADDYYGKLLEYPEAAPLFGTMKRKLAAALIEEGQTIINKVLKTDPAVLDNIWANRVHYDHLPAYFGRATALLGEKHYAWRDLKAKEYFFKAISIRKENYPDSSYVWGIGERRRLLDKSLEFDSAAAIVYFYLGYTFPAFSANRVLQFKKAAAIAPDWVLAHYMLGANTNGWDAISHYKKAIALDSNFLPSYNWVSWKYDAVGQPDSATYWRQLYVSKFLKNMETEPHSIKAYEYNDIGNALWRLKDYQRAKEFLLLGEKISDGKLPTIYQNLIVVLTDLLEFDLAIETCSKLIKLTGVAFWEGYPGNLYFYFLNDTTRAKANWLKAGNNSENFQIQAWLNMGDAARAFLLAKMNAAPDNELWFLAAESARLLGMADTAAMYYKRTIDSLRIPSATLLLPYMLPKNLFLCALSHHRLEHYETAQALLDSASVRLANDPWWPFYLICFYAQTGQPDKALDSLEKTVSTGWQPNPLEWLDGTLCDPYLNPIREREDFKALVKKYFPQYYDIATRIPGKH